MPKPRGSRHKQHEVLSERPQFEEGHSVVRVIRACGENLYEVEDGTGVKNLYHLPKRLRHIAFIRRGSYVFVRDDDTRGPGKVCGDIEVVIMDRFLNSLRTEPFWPAAFAAKKLEEASSSAMTNQNEEYRGDLDSQGDWEIGGGNPNRAKWDHVESESESSGDG